MALAVAVVAPTPAAARRAPEEVSCPAAEGNARFVRFAYLEILERCPDRAGAAYRTAQLDAGLPRSTVTDRLDMSEENLRGNNVVPLYQFLLGRPPTNGEVATGVADLRARHANDALTAKLLASDEGYALHSEGATPLERDTSWLAWAYARILDRAPDPHGQAFFLGYFAPSGSTATQRAKVAMGLERSRSNALSWVRASLAEGLGRTPDRVGESYWLQWLTGPTGRWRTFRMWTLILASDEAYRRSQTQPD